MNILFFIRFIPNTLVRLFSKCLAYSLLKTPNKGMLWKTRVNIALCFPELTTEEQEKLAKQSVRNQCFYYSHSFKCLAMPTEWNLQQIKSVENIEILKDALTDPSGTLIITPHLGNWEIMNPWVHQFAIPTIMYKPVKNKNINDFILKSRKRLHTKMVPTDPSGVKALFKNLKQGGFSVILPDHVPHPSGGISAPFFNIETLTSTLASKLAQKTKCRLISMCCVYIEELNGYSIQIEDISLKNSDLYNPDINIAVTAMNKSIESLIRNYPEHYMWGYKRFRGTAETKGLYNLDINSLRKISLS